MSGSLFDARYLQIHAPLMQPRINTDLPVGIVGMGGIEPPKIAGLHNTALRTTMKLSTATQRL
jgi:hypothetical protein